MWKVVHNPLEIFENTWGTLSWWPEAQFSFPKSLSLFLEFLQRKVIAYMVIVKPAFLIYDCVVTIFHVINDLHILKSKMLYIMSYIIISIIIWGYWVLLQSVTSSDKRETHLWRELGHISEYCLQADLKEKHRENMCTLRCPHPHKAERSLAQTLTGFLATLNMMHRDGAGIAVAKL